MRFAIVVGHSPKDPGATAYSGVSEFDFNSDLAEMVKDALQALGHCSEVFTHQPFSSYTKRQSDTADRIMASAASDAHIELHFNAANGNAYGFEYLHHYQSNKGKTLAKCLDIAQQEEYHSKRPRGTKELGPSARGFGFVTRTPAPRVICEPFFGDNRNDAEAYLNDPFRLACTIATGLSNYAKLQ